MAVILRAAATVLPRLGRGPLLRLAAHLGRTAAEAKVKVVKHMPLSFVPHTLTLTARTVSLPPLRAALAAAAVSGAGPLAAGANDQPFLAAALAAIAERRFGASTRGRWLRDLSADCCVCSRMLNADEQEALRGTVAERLMDDHERLAEQLHDAAAGIGEPFASLEVTPEEVDWSICLLLHHGLPGADPPASARKGSEAGGGGGGGSLVLAPGLLDGVQRHYDGALCAELARNVAPTGRLPGWALVPARDMAVGEQVWLCAPGASNPQFLALYGIAYADNPFGPVMMQGGVLETRLAAARGAAESANCQPEDVTTLSLHHNKSATLTDENVRCSSLVWMGDIGAAFEAMEAGYFATWPRREAVAQDRWLAAEATLYRSVGASCNRSLEALRESAKIATLERLQQAAAAGRELSRLSLLVRARDVELHKDCARWTAARSEMLIGADMPSQHSDQAWRPGASASSGADAWPPTHEEL